MSEAWEKFVEQENRKRIEALETQVKELRKEVNKIDLAELKVENTSYPASNKYCDVDDDAGELE